MSSLTVISDSELPGGWEFGEEYKENTQIYENTGATEIQEILVIDHGEEVLVSLEYSDAHIPITDTTVSKGEEEAQAIEYMENAETLIENHKET